MTFRVIFSPKSCRQIKSFSVELRDRIKSAVVEIGNDPWHKGTIKVKGYENIRRKRAGKIRILYTTDRQRNEVLVVKVEKRDEATYK